MRNEMSGKVVAVLLICSALFAVCGCRKKMNTVSQKNEIAEISEKNAHLVKFEKSSKNKSKPRRDPIEITLRLQKNKLAAINGLALSTKKIVPKLRELISERDQTQCPLTLICDQDVLHSDIIEMLDLLKAEGYSTINMKMSR